MLFSAPLLLLFPAALIASPLPDPKQYHYASKSRSGSSSVEVTISGDSSALASLLGPGPYNLDDAPGFVLNTPLGSNYYGANSGLGGHSDGLEYGLPMACKALMGKDDDGNQLVKKDFGAKTKTAVVIGNKFKDKMQVRILTWDAKTVGAGECAKELGEAVRRYKKCRGSVCMVRKVWVYAQEGHVKFELNWL